MKRMENGMMFGLDIRKGFISVLAIGYLMVICSISSIQMAILENRMQFYRDLEMMDKRVYFEVMIMERIKDSFVQELNEDCKVSYEGMLASLDYEENVVVVEYDCEDEVYSRKYVYNTEFGFLLKFE